MFDFFLLFLLNLSTEVVTLYFTGLYNCSLLDDLQEEDGNTANSYSTIACDHCMNSIGRNYLATIKVNETMLFVYSNINDIVRI